MQALRAGGSPPAAMSLLPGEGETGAALVRHPRRPRDRVHRLAAGRKLRSSAPPRRRHGQNHFKRVVAELGGKNCVIVAADADLDEAVPAIVALGIRLRRPEVLGGLARARRRGRSPSS